jgi:hypothetical protein
VPILEAAGATAEAEAMRQRARALLAPFQKWKARRSETNYDDIESAGGILTAMLLPAIGEPLPSEKDLAYERITWYVLIERAGFTLLLHFFVLLMLLMLLVALRWRWTKGFAAAPILILPRAWDSARILAVSVFAPLAVYYVFTRYSGLSGREHSLAAGGASRVLVEMLAISVAILFLATWVSVRHTWRRCRELGLPVPVKVSPWRILLLAIIPLGIPVWLLIRKREGLFRGSVARSLIPVFASVVILVGLATQPYLTHRERTLVANDPLYTCVETGAGFSKPEAQLVERLRREALAVFDELEKKTAAAP